MLITIGNIDAYFLMSELVFEYYNQCLYENNYEGLNRPINDCTDSINTSLADIIKYIYDDEVELQDNIDLSKFYFV